MKKNIKNLLIKKMPVSASKYFYWNTFKKRLNLKNPTTFNEKLMWLKLYEDDSQKARCADKYLVRDYVSQLGYSNILVDLFKVYENVEEISFQELPESFVMKCTHGSGFNIICPNKEKMDKKQTIVQLKKWMKSDYGLRAAEPHYSKIKPRIIVERFLDDELNGQLPTDYMIHCFHGTPHVIEVGVDNGDKEKMFGTFNCDWDVLPYFDDSVTLGEVINKPGRLEEMLEISRELSKAFTYVRVDLYYSDNKIYFGELTFTPAACLDYDFINDADLQMGELLDLTVFKKEALSKVSIKKPINLASKIWPMLFYIG